MNPYAHRHLRPILGIAALCTLCWAAGCAPPQVGHAEPQDGSSQGTQGRTVRKLTPAEVPARLGAEAYGHACNIVAFGPRTPGSQAWQQQVDYITAELRRLHLEPVIDAWTDPKEGIRFQNVTALIPGKRKERIVLAAHHDTKVTHGHEDPAHNFEFQGANDGASGVGLLLAMAKVLCAGSREATVQLVFLDGEESLDWNWNEAKRALFGSRRFVKEYRDAQVLGKADPIVAMVLLDMVGGKDVQIQEETYSTATMREILWSAAVACHREQHFFKVAEGASDDHKPFLDAGIPAVDLIDLKNNPTWHKATDTIENLSPESLQLVGEVVLTMLPEVEREYVPKLPAIR
jgi:Peptidase family M28